MPAYRVRTTVLAASLLLVSAFGPLPAQAQDRDAARPATLQSLSEDMAKLRARVAKLEGNLKAADLVGTYNLVFIDNALSALVPGNPPRHATITTFGGKITMTLNEDRTLTFDGTCGGTQLTEGDWQVTQTECINSQGGGTWTYADGTVTLLLDGDQIALDVSLGGRLLTLAFNSFHAGADQSSDNGMWIASRK